MEQSEKQPAQKKDLDPASKRLMEFINKNGGSAAVAKAIGKLPQTIYNIEKGTSKASLDTMREIATAFPSLDLNWVITGAISTQEYHHPTPGAQEHEAKASEALTSTQSAAGLSVEYIREILAENKELKQELRDARAEVREAYQNYHAIVKPEFSSQTPIYSPFGVVARPDIGFKQISTKVRSLNKSEYRSFPFLSVTQGNVTTPLTGRTNRQQVQ